MAIITGRVFIYANGELLRNKKGAIARGIGGFERKPIIEEVYHGPVEEAVAAECEFSVTDANDKSLIDLFNINGDGTIVFEVQGGGKTYIMREAVCKGNIEVTAGEGEAKILFFGPKWEEQL